MADASELKRDLRRRMKAARSALPPAERRALSDRIQARVVASAPFARARGVALYAAVRGEAATDAVARAVLAAGKALAYPRMTGDDGEMRFYWVDSLDGLRPGRHGILEPDEARPAGMAEFDLILVPGLAFDATGHRLGWGGGYYDRVLADRPAGAATVGLAYEMQILPALPRDAHDVHVDAVATEARWIETSHPPRAGGGG